MQSHYTTATRVFPDLDSNQGLRVQSAESIPLDYPGSVGAGGVEPRVGRLSCGCTSVVLRTLMFRTLKGFRTSRDELEAAKPPLPHAIFMCPVQELNLTLRCFRPTLVTMRASGAKGGIGFPPPCFPL